MGVVSAARALAIGFNALKEVLPGLGVQVLQLGLLQCPCFRRQAQIGNGFDNLFRHGRRSGQSGAQQRPRQHLLGGKHNLA